MPCCAGQVLDLRVAGRGAAGGELLVACRGGWRPPSESGSGGFDEPALCDCVGTCDIDGRLVGAGLEVLGVGEHVAQHPADRLADLGRRTIEGGAADEGMGVVDPGSAPRHDARFHGRIEIAGTDAEAVQRLVQRTAGHASWRDDRKGASRGRREVADDVEGLRRRVPDRQRIGERVPAGELGRAQAGAGAQQRDRVPPRALHELDEHRFGREMVAARRHELTALAKGEAAEPVDRDLLERQAKPREVRRVPPGQQQRQWLVAQARDDCRGQRDDEGCRQGLTVVEGDEQRRPALAGHPSQRRCSSLDGGPRDGGAPVAERGSCHVGRTDAGRQLVQRVGPVGQGVGGAGRGRAAHLDRVQLGGSSEGDLDQRALSDAALAMEPECPGPAEPGVPEQLVDPGELPAACHEATVGRRRVRQHAARRHTDRTDRRRHRSLITASSQPRPTQEVPVYRTLEGAARGLPAARTPGAGPTGRRPGSRRTIQESRPIASAACT